MTGRSSSRSSDRKRGGARSICLLTCSFLLLAVPARPSVPSERASGGGLFELTPVMRVGEPVGGEPFLSSGVLFESGSFNDEGQVGLFGLSLYDSSNPLHFLAFASTRSTTTFLVEPIVDSEIGFTRPTINDRGDAVFVRRRSVPGNLFLPVLTLYSQGRLTDILLGGDVLVPGYPVENMSRQPSINDDGVVALVVLSTDPGRDDDFAVYTYADGVFTREVGEGDPAPGGGVFEMNFGPLPPARINDRGDILFWGLILRQGPETVFGLFLKSGDTIRAVLRNGDSVPTGGTVLHVFGGGAQDMNDLGNVALKVELTGGPAKDAIVVDRDGELGTIVAEGDPSPLGGHFASLFDVRYHNEHAPPSPMINDAGAVLFAATTILPDGRERTGLFLSDGTATVKVVAQGDRLPSGMRLDEVLAYDLNDRGQVAFYAQSDALYIAEPVAPNVASAKLRAKGGQLVLQLKGTGFVTNGSTIEIDGTPLDDVEYPESARRDDGTTKSIRSTDPRLDDLVAPGATVSVTVYDALTGLRSAPFTLTR